MKIRLFLLIATVSILSCNNEKEKANSTAVKTYVEIKKADWLIGSWHSISPEGTVIESWSKQNDSVYSGTSFFIIGKDTVSSESISLEQTGDELSYNPTVKNQNDNKAVKFKLTSSTGSQLIFENPFHDFPQKITYTKINNDSLQAEISGMSKGKPAAEIFNMSRVKE